MEVILNAKILLQLELLIYLLLNVILEACCFNNEVAFVCFRLFQLLTCPFFKYTINLINKLSCDELNFFETINIFFRPRLQRHSVSFRKSEKDRRFDQVLNTTG